MKFSRRSFIKAGSSALPLGFLACKQEQPFKSNVRIDTENRNLVVLYLAGGNDALSFLVPYSDHHYYKRRPTQSLSPESVIRIGRDQNGVDLGLHPSLRGLSDIYGQGNAAIIQRVGYPDASRSHFLGGDIVSTADPTNHKGNGWLGKYMDTLTSPLDPLFGWNTQFQLPRAFYSDTVQVSSIADPKAFIYYNPWNELESAKKLAAMPQSSELATHLSQTAYNALSTLDRVSGVTPYQPTVDYPDTELAKYLKLIASAIASNIGTKIFWVQMAGFDTHSNQGTRHGRFSSLMDELDGALLALHNDLRNQHQLDNTALLQYSEFGRRIDENGSGGTDHGAAGVMSVIGGAVSGGLYGAAARSLEKKITNPELENNALDVRPSTDFRAVYAELLENWLMTDSQAILGGDYRDPSINFLSSHT